MSKLKLVGSKSRPDREMLDQIDRLQVELNQLRDQLPSFSLNNNVGVSLGALKRQIRARRAREEHLGPELFSDPAWDILLELLVAELEQRRVAVTAVCRASGAPMTTALRWLDRLDASGFLHRQPDPFDSRRFYVSLSANGSAAMHRYFSDVGPDARC